jgi:endonuclease/exonuclease/phosphatase family metal-dependent hydrolase
MSQRPPVDMLHASIGRAGARRILTLLARLVVGTAFLTTAFACAHQFRPTFEISPPSALPCRQLASPADVSIWIVPSKREASEPLARWCGTVGPVLFQSQPAAGERSAINRLGIVSWNIHEGGGDVDELVRRLRLGEFSGGEPVDQFVLLLQEATRADDTVPQRLPRGAPSPHRIAPSSGRPDGDVHRFADQGMAVLYAPSMRNGGADGTAEDRGNAIVSTVPLQRPRLIELPLQHQRRVAVMAAVAGRNSSGTPWRVDLIDVHLDTTLALWHGGPWTARRHQATALVDALHSLPPSPSEPTATILAGDLNSWLGADDGAVRVLRETFDGAVVLDRRPTWIGPLGLHATLDHIFIRGAASPARIMRLSSRFGSDHYPLLLMLDFCLH